MSTAKTAIIVTIPLVYYHGSIYWGLYTEQTGQVRKEIKDRPTGGKQVPFAFEQALKQDGNILFIVDDKFNMERTKDLDPAVNEIDTFLKEQALPAHWLDLLLLNNGLERIVTPPPELAATSYAFSEKMLYALSKHEYGLPGECANEWTLLLDHLAQRGYENVQAYIPKVCAKGICYATPYAKESGIYGKPITINFTDGSGISSVYDYQGG